jgi:hypothetical protein
MTFSLYYHRPPFPCSPSPSCLLSAIVDGGVVVLLWVALTRTEERKRKRVLATHAIRRTSVHSSARERENNKVCAHLFAQNFNSQKKRQVNDRISPFSMYDAHICLHMGRAEKKVQRWKGCKQ